MRIGIDEVNDPAVALAAVDPDLKPSFAFHFGSEGAKPAARLGQVMEHTQRIRRVKRSVL